MDLDSSDWFAKWTPEMSIFEKTKSFQRQTHSFLCVVRKNVESKMCGSGNLIASGGEAVRAPMVRLQCSKAYSARGE